MEYFTSNISGNRYPENEKIQLALVRNSILEYIKKKHPEVSEQSYISLSELDDYRQMYIEYSLKNEFEELTSLEDEVINKLRRNEYISKNIEDNLSENLSFGQKIADKVADFGGSWRFIILFSALIALWVTINSVAFFFNAFDPYPFILLNLFLSCIAAFQAPIIMMSQNRQEEKDRARAKENYKVSLKSEVEIQTLEEKIDHLILIQQQRLFEVQNIQVEMLKEIRDDISKIKKANSK